MDFERRADLVSAEISRRVLGHSWPGPPLDQAQMPGSRWRGSPPSRLQVQTSEERALLEWSAAFRSANEPSSR